jgi:methylphosphotriester-DNA--protein-cysteine methyltransferase
MTVAADSDTGDGEFSIEVISTGVYASGFGRVGDGRSFAFHTRRQLLVVEVYRPRLRGTVPQAEDVVAMATRTLTDIDMTDERSIAAVVRDAVAAAHPVLRPDH